MNGLRRLLRQATVERHTDSQDCGHWTSGTPGCRHLPRRDAAAAYSNEDKWKLVEQRPTCAIPRDGLLSRRLDMRRAFFCGYSKDKVDRAKSLRQSKRARGRHRPPILQPEEPTDGSTSPTSSLPWSQAFGSRVTYSGNVVGDPSHMNPQDWAVGGAPTRESVRDWHPASAPAPSPAAAARSADVGEASRATSVAAEAAIGDAPAASGPGAASLSGVAAVLDDGRRAAQQAEDALGSGQLEREEAKPTRLSGSSGEVGRPERLYAPGDASDGGGTMLAGVAAASDVEQGEDGEVARLSSRALEANETVAGGDEAMGMETGGGLLQPSTTSGGIVAPPTAAEQALAAAQARVNAKIGEAARAASPTATSPTELKAPKTPEEYKSRMAEVVMRENKLRRQFEQV